MRAEGIGKPEKEELDEHVRRILRDLGNPPPPLNLDDVRSLLRLDKKYYSTNDDSFLKEIIHVMHIAGKQVLLKPSRLIDAIKQIKLSALWIPHTKTILIDKAEPAPKHRWMEGHEISHSLASWHKDFLLGDDDTTLNHSCHETLEAEANYGSGRLLFMGPNFAMEARELSHSMASVFDLAKRYGNSRPSTLWRYIKEAFPEVPCYGLILVPPKISPTGEMQCKHVIESPAFELEFEEFPSAATAPNNFGMFRPKKWGSVGSGMLTLVDRNRKNRRFVFEGWTNQHEVLVLGLPA